jgi:hypothetical protein
MQAKPVARIQPGSALRPPPDDRRPEVVLSLARHIASGSHKHPPLGPSRRPIALRHPPVTHFCATTRTPEPAAVKMEPGTG